MGKKVDVNKINLTDQELKYLGYETYYGEGINIYYNSQICHHAHHCVKVNSGIVKEGRRPRILPKKGSHEECIEVVNGCPSGALKYKPSSNSHVMNILDVSFNP